MICPNCQKENDDGNQSCNGCGEEVSLNTQTEVKNEPETSAEIPKPADADAVKQATIKTDVLPVAQANLGNTEKVQEVVPTLKVSIEEAETPKAAQTNEPHALLGRVIDSRYRLDALIGDGGMGFVYRATRLQLNDTVAVKILHPKNCGDNESAERFRIEAQVSARLKHQNAVIIYDSGVTEDKLCYIVMELLEGVTLRQVQREKGTLALSDTIEIISQIASALDQAHQLGIIHRDLKPENIFIQTRNNKPEVKILDFGIAKIFRLQNNNLTRAGFAVGTPRYMSPEQCLGEELDQRTDIYSLGIITYELLTGIVPFNSPTDAALYTQHINQTPPTLRSINLSIPVMSEQVVMRALDKNRMVRQSSAGQFARELQSSLSVNNYPSYESQTVVTPLHSLSSGNISVPQYMSAQQHVGARPKQSKTPFILVGAAAVVVLGLAGFFLIPSFLQKTVLPDHFGLFNKKADLLTELRAREFSNLLKGRDELNEDSSLPIVESNANLILYSDQQTIPSVDLKLIKLDTIKPDGNIENWEYQIAPIDGNSELKQIKVRSGLPKGRYALALFKGNLDEGTHKLWAFQVESGAETPADPQMIALALKPTPAPTPTPQIITKTVPVPQQSFAFSGPTAVCTQGNVVLRSSPTISDFNKIGRLDRGQTVGVLTYSSNYETWNGITSRWVQVQTASGKVGWVFGAFLR